VIGALCAFLGAIMWKLSYLPGYAFGFSKLTYCFLILCVVKGAMKVFRNDTGVLTFLLMVLGIILIAGTGVTWWKVLLLLWPVLAGDASCGVFGCMLLLADLIARVVGSDLGAYEPYVSLKWVTLLCLSTSAFLLYQYSMLAARGRKDQSDQNPYLKRHYVGVLALLVYAGVAMWGVYFMTTGQALQHWGERLFGLDGQGFLSVGSAGLFLTILWLIREWWMRKIVNLR
jgi:hypothetical protein